MPRVCEKHFKRAVDTLTSLKDGTEYDLCQECLSDLQEYFKESDGTERTTKQVGRPKKQMA